MKIKTYLVWNNIRVLMMTLFYSIWNEWIHYLWVNYPFKIQSIGSSFSSRSPSTPTGFLARIRSCNDPSSRPNSSIESRSRVTTISRSRRAGEQWLSSHLEIYNLTSRVCLQPNEHSLKRSSWNMTLITHNNNMQRIKWLLFYIVFCPLNASGLYCAFICFISVFDILSFSHRVMFSAFYKFSPVCWAIYFNPVLWRLSLTLHEKKMLHVWLCIFHTLVLSVVSMIVSFCLFSWVKMSLCLQVLINVWPAALDNTYSLCYTNGHPSDWP